MADQFTYANAQCVCINSSTPYHYSGVVLRVSYGEKELRTENQWALVIGESMDSNPISSDFK